MSRKECVFTGFGLCAIGAAIFFCAPYAPSLGVERSVKLLALFVLFLGAVIGFPPGLLLLIGHIRGRAVGKVF